MPLRRCIKVYPEEKNNNIKFKKSQISENKFKSALIKIIIIKSIY